MKILDKAIDIAYEAHEGQMYGDYQYIRHILQVVNSSRKLFRPKIDDDSLEIVALLHDSVEDCEEVTKDSLVSDGIPLKLVEAIILVTKKEGVSYKDYLKTLSRNELAWKVKVADTYCNLTESIKGGDVKRVRKYSKQIELLYKFKSWEE